MGRAIKIIAVLGVLLVAVVVGGIFILKSLDFNEYKGLIAEQVKSATGRDMVIAGDLKLEISLSPSIAVEDVTFANASWGTRPEMLKLKRLETEVELLPLLMGGDLRVKRLILVGLDVLVETDSSGRGNWEFGAPAEKTEETSGEGGLLPVVQKILMEDVHVVYRDGVTGEVLKADIESLEVTADSIDSPLRMVITGAYNGAAYAVAGELGAINTLLNGGKPFPVSLTIDALDVKLGVKGSITKPREVKGLDLTISVEGVDLTKTVTQAQVLVPALKNLTVPPIGPFKVSARLKGSAQKMSVSDIKLSVGRAENVLLSASGNIEDAIGVTGLDVTVGAKGADLAQTIKMVQPLVPALKDMAVPDVGPYDVAARVRGSLDKMSVSDIKLSVGREEQVRLSVKGSIKNALAATGLDIEVWVQGKDLSPIAGMVDGQLPDLPPFNITARLTDSDGGYSLDNIKVTIGKSDISGRASVSLAGPRPALEADFSSTLLNVDEILPPEKKDEKKIDTVKEAASPDKGDGLVFPNDPLPLDGLKAVDAKIKFKAKRIIARGMIVDNVAVNVSLRGGTLQVKPFSAVVSTGTISGSVLLDGAQKIPVLEIKVKAKQVDYGTLLKQFGMTDIASGKINLETDIRGTGSSVRAIMARLNGRIRLTSQGGRVESGLLNILSADVMSVLPGVDSKGDKDIRCIVVHFDITSGKASARSILFDTGGISLIGKGGMNLADETLDLKFDPRPKKASLLQASIPFNVGGTFASPSVVPDVAGLAVGAAKTVAGVIGGAALGGAGLLGGLIGSNQGSASKSVDQTDYCKLALAGKSLVATKTAAPATSTTQQAPASIQPAQPVEEKSIPEKAVESVGDTLKSVGEGIGSGLKSLFGN